MKSSKVQWLQRMGIDVWRRRNVAYASQRAGLEEPTRETTEAVNSSSISRRNRADNHSTATKTDSSPSLRKGEQTKSQELISTERIRIDVCCSIGAGLLLIKDDDALDRDFTEDVFRAFQQLKSLSSEESTVSFFQFSWPAESHLRYVKDANDATLESARRAFLAYARSFNKELPSHVVGVGKGAIQLSDKELFAGARVLHSLEDPVSPAFKRLLWNFLRDDR